MNDKYRVDNVKVELVEMTPEWAGELLAINTHNRNLRPREISTRTREILNEGWVFDGDTIKVSVEGVLLDGQHRLHAIVEAGMTVPLILVTGIEPKAMLVIDTGLKRSFADFLRLNDETSSNDKAALVRKILLWDAGLFRSQNIKYSTQEMYNKYMSQKAEIDDAVTTASRLNARSHRQIMPRSVMGLAWWVLSNVDVASAEYFFDRLADGSGLEVGHPIYALRRKLDAEEFGAKSSAAQYKLMGLTIKAWNMWLRGEDCKVLTFRVGGRSPEPMPTPIKPEE